jgi:thiamine transport system ATP-binding protein
MLTIESLTFLFSDFTGCYSLRVPEGSLVGLVGPSGGGKTTLLDGLAGFIRPVAGKLQFNAADLLPLSAGERPMATIFQDFNLFPGLSVTQNIGLGLDPSLKLSPAQRDGIERVLGEVDLAGFGQRMPGSLSGGERQRVALARALISGKRILLLDEPFSGLDPGLRKAMIALVDRLRLRHRLTVLLSIHTPQDLIGHADSVAFITSGKVAFSGTPQALFAVQDDPAIARYLG